MLWPGELTPRHGYRLQRTYDTHRALGSFVIEPAEVAQGDRVWSSWCWLTLSLRTLPKPEDHDDQSGYLARITPTTALEIFSGPCLSESSAMRG